MIINGQARPDKLLIYYQKRLFLAIKARKRKRQEAAKLSAFLYFAIQVTEPCREASLWFRSP
jgi:hypothetical protein